MTKEELEKAALAIYKTGSYPQVHPDSRAFVHGYLSGAEPREKRITELEKELEQERKKNEEIKVRFVKCSSCTEEMKDKCLMFSENLCEGERCEELVDLVALVNQSELQNKYSELEQKNAELKERNAELKGMYAHSAREASTYKQFLELKEKEIAELDCQKNRNKTCYSCVNATERCFKNEIGCPCGEYKSYKDENAELKSKIKWYSEQVCYKECAEVWGKAKEIMKMFLAIANNEVEYVQDVKDCKDYWEELCKRAEQFLKEGE